MKEMLTRRNIMEAAEDERNRSVSMQLTLHGYTAEESAEAEKRLEKAWEDIKSLLHLKDLTDKEAAGAALERN